MNPTEIYDALCEISAKPFDAAEFPFEFALAMDAAQAAVAKLRNGSTNKSDLPGGVLFNKKFHFVSLSAMDMGKPYTLKNGSTCYLSM